MAVCSEIHTKHINTAVWAERRIVNVKLAFKAVKCYPWPLRIFEHNLRLPITIKDTFFDRLSEIRRTIKLSKQYLSCNGLNAVAPEQPNLQTL